MLIIFILIVKSSMSQMKKQAGSDFYPSFKEMHSELRQKQSTVYTFKIDRENIIEEYRSLRQKQQQFLAKINMKDQLKKQLFGFPDSYYCQNTEKVQKIVIENHPFMGKLVIDEKKWLENEEQRKKEKKSKQNISYAKLDIEFEKQERIGSDQMLLDKPIPNGEKLLQQLLINNDGKNTQISSIEPRGKKDFSSEEEMMRI